MPVKTPDGVVHNIYEPESDDRWGSTFCLISFTTKRKYEWILSDITFGVHVRTHVTCLSCLGSKR